MHWEHRATGTTSSLRDKNTLCICYRQSVVSLSKSNKNAFKKQLIHSIIMMICVNHQNACFHALIPIFGFLEIFSVSNLPIIIWKCLAKQEIKHNAQSQDKVDSVGGRDVLVGPNEKKKFINIFPSFQNKICLDRIGPIDQLLKVWTGVNCIEEMSVKTSMLKRLMIKRQGHLFAAQP